MNINQSFILSRKLKSATLALSIVALAALSACNKQSDGQTAGQKLDAALAGTQQAAEEAKAKAEASMAKAGDAMKAASQKTEGSGTKTLQSMAGIADDAAITASISAEFAKDADLSAFKINVDTKDGNVSLNGPAPTAAARDKATKLAKSIKGVASVSNNLTVKPS